MGQHEQVVDLTGLAAHVVLEQALRLEPELREHRHGGLLLGDDLDDELRRAHLDGLDDGPLGEQPAEPVAAVRGIDDEAQLADVVAPADALEDRDLTADLTVDERDEPVLRRVVEPRLDHAVGEDVLAEERAVALGHAGEEAPQRVGVTGAEGPHLDLRAGPPARHTGSEWRSIQSAIVGMLWRWAVRPAITPT